MKGDLIKLKGDLIKLKGDLIKLRADLITLTPGVIRNKCVKVIKDKISDGGRGICIEKNKGCQDLEEIEMARLQ